MSTKFTVHAFDRVAERLSLEHRAIAELLDSGFVVDLGFENGRQRKHRLFYSMPDSQCFIAIQDMRNFEVITVLPVDYHENISWKIDLGTLESARIAAVTGKPPCSVNINEFNKELRQTKSAPIRRKQSITSFKLVLSYKDSGGKDRLTNLGSLPAEPYDAEFKALLADDKIYNEIKWRIQSRGFLKQLDIASTTCVYVKRGKNGNDRIAITSGIT